MERVDELVEKRRYRSKIIVPHYDQQDANPPGNIDVTNPFRHICILSSLDCTPERNTELLIHWIGLPSQNERCLEFESFVDMGQYKPI